LESESLKSLTEAQRLEIAICQALVKADELGLSMVGIHLCNALEVLRQEHPALNETGGTDSDL
jgi:hypothetical protein